MLMTSRSAISWLVQPAAISWQHFGFARRRPPGTAPSRAAGAGVTRASGPLVARWRGLRQTPALRHPPPLRQEGLESGVTERLLPGPRHFAEHRRHHRDRAHPHRVADRTGGTDQERRPFDLTERAATPAKFASRLPMSQCEPSDCIIARLSLNRDHAER